jgi:hypothetical protein
MPRGRPYSSRTDGVDVDTCSRGQQGGEQHQLGSRGSHCLSVVRLVRVACAVACGQAGVRSWMWSGRRVGVACTLYFYRPISCTTSLPWSSLSSHKHLCVRGAGARPVQGMVGALELSLIPRAHASIANSSARRQDVSSLRVGFIRYYSLSFKI